jgi:hypothetical protein
MSKSKPIEFGGIRPNIEFVQQPVGQLFEPLKTRLPGIEPIEREWHACRHTGRKGV